MRGQTTADAAVDTAAAHICLVRVRVRVRVGVGVRVRVRARVRVRVSNPTPNPDQDVVGDALARGASKKAQATAKAREI